MDRAMVRCHVIALARLALRLGPPVRARPVAVSQRHDAGGVPRCPPLGLRVTGPEAIGGRVSGQIFKENTLRSRPNIYHAITAAVLGFVRLGAVHPYVGGAIDVHGPDETDLGRPHAGQLL